MVFEGLPCSEATSLPSEMLGLLGLSPLPLLPRCWNLTLPDLAIIGGCHGKGPKGDLSSYTLKIAKSRYTYRELEDDVPILSIDSYKIQGGAGLSEGADSW